MYHVQRIACGSIANLQIDQTMVLETNYIRQPGKQVAWCVNNLAQPSSSYNHNTCTDNPQNIWGSLYECNSASTIMSWKTSNSNTNISKCYRKHENDKKRVYEQRIRETEHSSFTPLVFSTTGRMGRQATVFYQWLAAMLAEKWDQSYGSMLNWLRCSISISLLRSAIQCIRGARSCIQEQPYEGAAPSGLGHFWFWDFLKHPTILFTCSYFSTLHINFDVTIQQV